MPAAELTAELRAQIHAALEQTHGHRRQAAALLGWECKQLNGYLYTDTELRLKWVGGRNCGRRKRAEEPPPKAVTLHRPMLVDEAQEGLAAIAQEDQLVKQGLSALGISGSQLDLVESWRKLHGRHYRGCLELIGGGITHQFIKLATEIEYLDNEIAAISGSDLAREAILRQDRQKLLEIQGRTFDRANKAALGQAMIRHKLQSGKEKKKPGYLNIQAQAGSKVQVVQTDMPRPEAGEIMNATEDQE